MLRYENVKIECWERNCWKMGLMIMFLQVISDLDVVADDVQMRNEKKTC